MRKLDAMRGLLNSVPKSRRKHHRGSLHPESLENRVLLAVGPQLISIQPDIGEVLQEGTIRNVAPRELTFVFNENQAIDADSLDGIRITRAGFDNAFDGVTDVIVDPGFIGVDPLRPNEVIVRFAETLPDDIYRVELFGIDDFQDQIVALRNTEGDPFSPEIVGADRTVIGFELDLGSQLVSVVPQPITREADGSLSQARNQIKLYFNNDDLSVVSAENPAFYELIFTNDTVSNDDDVIFTPASVDYNTVFDTATLTFAADIDQLATGTGTYRLRVGTDEAIPAAPLRAQVDDDPGSSFVTATDLGSLQGSQILAEEIRSGNFPLAFPGAVNEPGHRDINVQSHFEATAVIPDAGGIQTISYNFQELYGLDAGENQLFNLITENQKDRARDVFALYQYYLGVQFVETADEGITVVTGDMRLLDPGAVVARGGVLGIAGLHPETEQPTVILDNQELWDDQYGETLDPFRESWMEVAMHEIGHILGLGHTDELAHFSVMAGEVEDASVIQDIPFPFEKVYPGKEDIVHGQFLFRPESNDIDVYQFELTEPGVFKAETIAERLNDSSLLDSALKLYKQEGSERVAIAQNDDYFSEDSFIELDLAAGTYFIAVTSTGNTQIDPVVEDSGFGGTSQGDYELRLDFRPRVDNFLVDETNTAFDGDADGIAGGIFNFWFQAVSPSDTVYVDKAAVAGGNGTLDRPFNNIRVALTSANGPSSGDILRIVGNGGSDGDVNTLADNLAYEIGRANGASLPDGVTFEVPQGVTVVIDEGAIFKMLSSNIHVGSSAVGIDRSAGALQVLGTPSSPVQFTSYDDQIVGVDNNPRNTSPDPGDWGGLLFQNDVDRAEGRFDYEQVGVYLNVVNNANMRYGGGLVTINSAQRVIDPVHMIDSRPTVGYNTIRLSADAALSANPDSFEETYFTASDSLGIDYQATPFTPDYNRIGPDIRGNRLIDNSINGILVRIDTPAGDQLETLSVAGRWDDTDIVHVVPENLVVEGTAAGPIKDEATGELRARTDASLRIDPSIIVKLDGSRIEATIGANLLAEGRQGERIVFTSLLDDRFGAGGTFNTSAPTNEGSSELPSPGDWGGFHFSQTSSASIDHAVVAFAGGLTRIEGSFAGFNAIEVMQADLRLTNSVFENNANGRGGQAEPEREGRGINDEGLIFVRGAQPIIVNNIMKGSEGFYSGVINIDANSLDHQLKSDTGRSTGAIDLITDYRDNQGPLVRGNQLTENSINGMVVRGGVMSTQGVWDDTDIVHVLFDEIVVPNFHTYGGVRLESSSDESLVVKLLGNQAGFKATGKELDIDDRIGGAVHVIGQPGHPVVLTSLADDTVGAGFDPSGRPQTDTDGFRREAAQNPPGSFEIDLNFGPNILLQSKTMEAIEDAARIWESLVEDPIRITLDIEQEDLGDGTLGATANEWVFIDFDTVRAAMIADARSHETIVSQIPDFANFNASLPFDSQNPYSVSQTMQISAANALALGFTLTGGVTSEFDPTEIRHARIAFNLQPVTLDTGGGIPSFSDVDRTDGIQPGYSDLVATAVHEIGHALGFTSAVDDIFAGTRAASLNTLDLFRLEPGRGGEDFTNAPRALDPNLVHVFYDGGNYDPFGLPMPGLRMGDIPLSTAADGNQASHWKDVGMSIGLLDPTSQEGETNLSEADRIGFDLIGWDVVGDPVPGDWRGITLEQNSNDRNVAIVTESESSTAIAPGTNSVPSTAQVLGSIGRGETDSDENLRLGFEIHGFLNDRNDVDVFAFNAKAGTEVWFDLDRTASTLDSIVEIIDATGTIVAASNDSIDDSLFTGSTVFSTSNVIAHGLQKSIFQPEDFWSLNPKDAGMRVELPGAGNESGLYHVRIRSNGSDLTNITGGETSGAYQLQLRLSEVDEFPGSTVQFADIRYPVDGVRVKGLPQHSPLLGEHSEEFIDQNDATALPFNSKILLRPPSNAAAVLGFQEAQYLGNILNKDQAAVSLSGFIENVLDLDHYVFNVAYDEVQNVPGGSVDLILDLDYADGLARANTTISIYEAELVNSNPSHPEVLVGNLIFNSNTDGETVDDIPRPLQGNDGTALEHGSVGRGDPFLGPITLPTGLSPNGFYVLQVSTQQFLPCEDGQFTQRLPCNPFVRAEPPPTVLRVADDHINGDPPLIGDTVDDPTVPVLVDRNSIVPFHLGDVPLFVTTQTSLVTVDPFRGGREVSLGTYLGDAATGGIQPVVGDIALRDNPNFDPTSADPETARRQRLHAFSLDIGTGLLTDNEIGNYLWLDIDPTDVPDGPVGTVLVRGVGEDGALTDDGVETYVNAVDPAADPPNDWDMELNLRRAGSDPAAALGVGITYDAYTFANPSGPFPDIEFGYAIGGRTVDDQPDGVGSRGIPNILYRFDATTGAAFSASPDGGPRPEEERAAIPPDNDLLGDVPMPMDPMSPFAMGPNAGTNLFESGVLDTAVCRSIVDGTFSDCPRAVDPLLVPELGGNITGIAFLGSTLYGVTDDSHLFRITGQDGPAARARYVDTLERPILDDDGNQTLDDDGFPAFERFGFEGLTRGPQNVEDGAYRNFLFAMDGRGNMVAFNPRQENDLGEPAVELQPIFVDGETVLATGASGARGLAFGTVDENLWHISQQRAGDLGRTAPNGFYFGEEQNPNGGTGRRYDFAGGAHGSIITNPFSLDGIAQEDLPTLYFTYLALTEEGFTPTARDAFRVFISDNSRDDNKGQWHLVGSTVPGEEDLNLDVFGDDTIEIDAQQLWDNTWQDVPFQATNWQPNGARDPIPYPDEDDQRPFDPGQFDWALWANSSIDERVPVWRQARIDVSDFAGSSDLRLRFDFSTAGSFDQGGASTKGGSELHAIAGNLLRDGDTFVVDGETFEFDLGFEVRPASGRGFNDGDTLTINDAGTDITIEFDKDGTVSPAADIGIGLDDTLSSLAIADGIRDILENSGLLTNTIIHQQGPLLFFQGATAVSSTASSFIITGDLGTTGIPVVVDAGMDPEDVAEAMRQPLADTFADGNVDTIKTYKQIVRIIGHGVDDPGKLGYSNRLPGDANGSFTDPLRFKTNTQVDYTFDDEEQNFTVIQEGVYIDDLLIGMRGRGEIKGNFRVDHPRPDATIPDVYEPSRGSVIAIPLTEPIIDNGEYQLEIRRTSEAAGLGVSFPASTRFRQAVTLIAPDGWDLFDGKTFTLGDGTRSVTFEFEDDAFLDGVASGNLPIEFNADSNDRVIAASVRDAINNQSTIEILAGTGDRKDAGESIVNTVNLFGNPVIFPEDSGNGLQAIVFDLYGDINEDRDQGQVIISGNTVTNARSFGIVVEDGLRDLPEYTFFDPLDSIKHAQDSEGDYVPHPGPTRQLNVLNDSFLAPGVTISNNVVAYSGDGGIHYGGDAHGQILTTPVAGEGGDAEAQNGFEFEIMDNNGFLQAFVVAGQVPARLPVVAGEPIPVQWVTDNNNPPAFCTPTYTAAGCNSRFNPLLRDFTEAMMHAIESSDLDVTLYRGRGDELFVEGAVSFLGTNPVGWLGQFVVPAQFGAVSFGRIVNNTLIGRGGSLESTTTEFTRDDFNDVGILVEDYASPTVMNNVFVNYSVGIESDITSTTLVQGGSLFQGNLRNASGTDVGDFGITVPNDDRLFVDWERGNFYPADNSRVIDSAVESLEDRADLVSVKNPLGISPSPVLSPSFDLLGQLRVDDPSVELPGGVGEDIFKDRGAIDRADFIGPTSFLTVPQDNDAQGNDENPIDNQVRIEADNLTRFVVRLSDVGEAISATGTGIDDGLLTSDSVVLLRDGVPLEPGVDYRFDYQATTNEIQLTPQAGIWLSGYSYEIVLVNEDQHVIEAITGADLADGLMFQVSIPDEQFGVVTPVFEFDSGYTLQMPETLSLTVEAGTSALSEVADGDIFTINSGLRLVTFELDSNNDFLAGRIQVPFTPSDTPDMVADAIANAIDSVGLGLAPQNLGNGKVHIGGPSNIALDTALSSLTQTGISGVISDGEQFAFENSERTLNFEFDKTGRINGGNLAIVINDNMTQDEIAIAVADAIAASPFGLSPRSIGGGQIALGGESDLVIRTGTTSIQVSGMPDVSPGVTAIPFDPTADEVEIAALLRETLEARFGDSLVVFTDEGNRTVLLGATNVNNIANKFVPAIRDFAGNKLETNQNSFPFDVRFTINLPAAMDFGDLPDPSFPTLLASNGARHVVVPTVFLGSEINDELDGQPTGDAGGDAGDDGITFLSEVIAGGRVPVLVNASTNGFLDGWIDLNRDGQFDPVTEQVFNSEPISRLFNGLRLEVPATASIGETYARFRFSTAGNLAPTGRADNGEVEDYRISVVSVPFPEAVSDTYTATEDVTLSVSAAQGVLSNDNDPQGDELTAILIDDVANGTLTLADDGSFTYIPNLDYFGPDGFTYLATDDVQDSAIVTVAIDVVSAPDPPTAGDDTATVLEDAAGQINLVGNDNDPDGALVRSSVEIVSQPTNGSVTVDENGVATYRPNANFFGNDEFTYTVKDVENAESNVATVSIVVTDVNDAPVANNDQLATRLNVSTVINLVDNDEDIDGSIDASTLVITLSPKSGTAIINDDGTVTFTPLFGFQGTDTFRYTVRDNDNATSNEGVVTISVTDTNQLPVAVSDEATTETSKAVVINVLANDFDPDGALVPGSLEIVIDAVNGTVEPGQSNSLIYTPNPGFAGTDTFSYVVRDDDNDRSNVALVTITVSTLTPWQNQVNRYDVTGDGFISPVDVLQVINEINSGGARELPSPPITSPPFSPPPFVDVSGDNFLSPVDALQLINFLNDEGSGPVAAVAAMGFAAQDVGAALEIEPRNRVAGGFASVDRLFADSETQPKKDVEMIDRDEIFELDTRSSDSLQMELDEDVIDGLASDGLR